MSELKIINETIGGENFAIYGMTDLKGDKIRAILITPNGNQSRFVVSLRINKKDGTDELRHIELDHSNLKEIK